MRKFEPTEDAYYEPCPDDITTLMELWTYNDALYGQPRETELHRLLGDRDGEGGEFLTA